MKIRTALFLILLVLVPGVLILPGGCKRGGSEQAATQAPKYTCPMHPSIVAEKPGDCPICGMSLVPLKSQQPAAKPQAAAVGKAPRYTCPMDPQVVSDKPAECPICGMDLVLMKEDSATSGSATSSVPGLAVVPLTAEARQVLGVTFGKVEKRNMAREIKTSARIVADESRLFRITPKVEGWVDKLMVSVTGQAVQKGEALLTIYSPQLVSAQQEYLTALQAAEKLAGAGEVAAEGAKSLKELAHRRLELWDVSDEQIATLEKTRQVEKTLKINSPTAGFVIEKNVMAGQKIMPSDFLMVVADLSVVWGDAAVYESDLPYVKVGMPMEITLPYWQDKKFEGKVSFVSPSLDPQTRTLRIRLEIPNPDMVLKLEMYANAKLSYPLGERLAVPEAAIMRTGEKTYAFRHDEEGNLVPVTVEVGVRGEGYYEIISGLREGDSVVTSANFLLDSESSMRAGRQASSHEDHK